MISQRYKEAAEFGFACGFANNFNHLQSKVRKSP